MTTRKKWVLSVLTASGLLLLSLVAILLHPGVLYAHQTTTRQLTIYHNQPQPDRWDLQLADGSRTSEDYFTYLVLTHYYLEVKHLTFQQLLRATTSAHTTRQQVLRWGQSEKMTKQSE